MAGLLNPIVAAVLMPFSSLTILGLTLRSSTVQSAAAGGRVMSIIWIVLPMALLFAAAAIAAFIWAARSGQLDDLDTPSVLMLEDDDDRACPTPADSEHR